MSLILDSVLWSERITLVPMSVRQLPEHCPWTIVIPLLMEA